MNYEEMSDRQINKCVAVSLGLKESSLSDMMYGSGLVVYPHDNEVNFNPCNNPSDAWKIIVDNGISIMKTNGDYGDDWTCGVANFHDGMWLFDDKKTGECVDFEVYGSNPLRAAMICFLKIKDEEK